MTPRKLAVGTPVKLMWIDSDYAQGWHYPMMGQYPSLAAKDRIATIGFVVSCTKESLVVSSTYAANGGVVTPLSVPWGCILKLSTLKRRKKNASRSKSR